MEAGYTHFEVDLTKDARTGKPRKDYRRVNVRYWRPHAVSAKQIPCQDCDRTFPNNQILLTHQMGKHGAVHFRPMDYSKIEDIEGTPK